MKTVLITRPLDQAKVLAEKLTQLNYTPIIFPAIEINPVNFDSTVDLNRFEDIIFVSPAAILNFHSLVKKLPKHLRIFTMGEDSAKIIGDLGWSKAIHPKMTFNRESLLKLPELAHISQKSVLIIEGKNGTPELKMTLELRGAKVSSLIVYERTLPHPKKLPELDTIDIVICTSQEGLKNLVTLFGPAIKHKPLLLSSQKLIALAKTLDFTGRIFLAENAGDSALIKALPI